MSDDTQAGPTLIERLRTDVLWHRRRDNETIAKDCEEAANEIERLRAIVKAGRAAYSGYGFLATPPGHEMYTEAGNALLHEWLSATDEYLRGADRAQRAKPVAWFALESYGGTGEKIYNQVQASAKHDPDVFPLYAAPPPVAALGESKLAAFGAWCVREFRRDLADVDGGSAQDAMERLGVIVKRTVTEPCGEECGCAECGDFPHECFVFPADVQEALATSTGATT
jgi:hypothetical protein